MHTSIVQYLVLTCNKYSYYLVTIVVCHTSRTDMNGDKSTEHTTATGTGTSSSTTVRWNIQCCNAIEFQKPSIISTGIGFLDHMIDQFYSHAQIGISIQVNNMMERDSTKVEVNHHHSIEYVNRHASGNQTELLSAVGTAIGIELRSLIDKKCTYYGSEKTSTFACPLDEALTTCVIIEHHHSTTGTDAVVSGCLQKYTLSPYGIYPIQTGRTHIGYLQTSAIEAFWKELSLSSGLNVQLTKIRGNNAHHIVESSFKAFARALRNFIDNINTIIVPYDNDTVSALLNMYGRNSENCRSSIELSRHAMIVRNTKETSIRTELHFDGGGKGSEIQTGITTLDKFLTAMASHANISLNVKCTGDLYIDEHHTAEDVAISIGQVLNDALGDKAGLNRMWSCNESTENSIHDVHVIMDLSNRPCLTHNVSPVLEHLEMIGDLSCEMLEHVLESIVVNARMTVHIVVESTETVSKINDINKEEIVSSLIMAIGRAFGQALKYCAMVDSRRAGTTASSKGTLSV